MTFQKKVRSLVVATLHPDSSQTYLVLFVLAGAATLSSIILSNVLDFVPCELCWYQRIFMWPITPIAAVAYITKDKFGYLYILPLAIVGWAIALYQNLLQWGVIQEDVVSCSLTSQSCADPEIQWLGFLTIPLGSLVMFTLIIGIMWRHARHHKENSPVDTQLQKNLGYVIVALAMATAIAVGLIQIFNT